METLSLRLLRAGRGIRVDSLGSIGAGQVSIGRRIATFIFWTLATLVAWFSFLSYSNLADPWLLGAVLFLCS